VNTVICTTPIRPTSTDYPPLGSMAVIQALRAAGDDPYFYDIDGLRPDFSEVERFFRERQPDVLGISAVVSTAYSYTKKLAQMVRRVSPKTRIVLGGNMAASAEILHRLAGIDYCVIGEGEIVSVNLFNYLRGRIEAGRPGDDYDALGRIRGLSFLDGAGDMVFTAYETRIASEELFDPDFTILEKHSKIENFIGDPMAHTDFAMDPRAHEPHRKGQKTTTVITAKGCVARCTFCHRWDKGYRSFPVTKVVERIKYLKDRYNVGFFKFGDENFGSDKRQVHELLEALKPLDILFHVAGVRCRTIDLPLLKKMKDAGCVALYYGMETGSQRILEVMEKNLSLEHNQNAVTCTQQSGLFTIYQLILGMPGENAQTIRETTEFFKKATEIMLEPPINRMSINYIQALPGTAAYEYARHKGLIGKSLKDEEAYLELISDINAGDDSKFINYTDADYLTVQSWRRSILLECTANYRIKNKLPKPTLAQIYKHLIWSRIDPAAYALEKTKTETGLDYNRGGYFNLQRGLSYDIVSSYFYPLRTPIMWTHLLWRESQRLGWRKFLGRVRETMAHRIFGPTHDAYTDYRSLRKVVETIAPPPQNNSEAAMAPMRAGR
jgi:radical SAM superfamily enzyme YgiQ (UPF0313 family)